MFWQKLKWIFTAIMVLVLFLVGFIVGGDTPSSGAKPTVVVPATSGQQKSFY